MKKRIRQISGCIGLLAVAMAGFGCASSSSAGANGASETPDPPPQGLNVWVAGGRAVTAKLENDDLVGPMVSLHRTPPSATEPDEETGLIQGSVFDRPVNITVRDGTARGIYGQRPVSLDVVDAPPGVTRVRGLIGGELSDFEIGPNHWTGHVGHCGYDLSGADQRFDGVRNCGHGTNRVRIEMAGPLTQWSPLEKATLLGLVLR